jgi:small subunit ribosomal protein S35
VSITTDRCPYRGQNLDYARYLVTALFHESWRREAWETKNEIDEEAFAADARTREQDSCGYAEVLEKVLNRGEDEATLRRYKEKARQLLRLPEVALRPEIVA